MGLDETRQLVGVEAVLRHPVAGADAELEGFERPLPGVEALVGGLHGATRGHGVDVAVWRAQVPEAAPVAVRVGGAAHALVLPHRPVQEVVAALVSRAGPVGDLVAGQAGPLEPLPRREVLVGLVVVVGVAGRVVGQRRTGLDGQRVGGDVRRVEGHRVVEGPAPVGERLPGAPVDQVEVERREAAGAHELDRARDVLPVVGAAQAGQHVSARRLHTERHPRYAPGAVGGEELLGHVVGVALHGDLGALGQRHPAEDLHQRRRRHQRRGAAPHEDRRRRRHPGSDEAVGVGTAGRQVRIGQVVAIRPRRERAVVAAGRAERHVEVDAERARAGGHRTIVAPAGPNASRRARRRERRRAPTPRRTSGAARRGER